MDARKFIDGWAEGEDVRNILRCLGEPALRVVMKEKLKIAIHIIKLWIFL